MEELTANECESFLKGTADFGSFYTWLFTKEPGQRRDRFRALDADKGGSLDITDLHAAIRLYMGLDAVPADKLLQPGALSKARASRQRGLGASKILDGSRLHNAPATYATDKKKVQRRAGPPRDHVEQIFERAVLEEQRQLWEGYHAAEEFILDGVQLNSTKDRGTYPPAEEGPLLRPLSFSKQGVYTGDGFYGLQSGMLLTDVRVDDSMNADGA